MNILEIIKINSNNIVGLEVVTDGNNCYYVVRFNSIEGLDILHMLDVSLPTGILPKITKLISNKKSTIVGISLTSPLQYKVYYQNEYGVPIGVNIDKGTLAIEYKTYACKNGILCKVSNKEEVLYKLVYSDCNTTKYVSEKGREYTIYNSYHAIISNIIKIEKTLKEYLQ